MTDAFDPGPGLRAWVRLPVTVVASSREVDLVLPGSLPVAELLPGLVAEVGPLGRGPAYAGHLLLHRGRALDPASGLAEQGVGPGERLLVTRAPWSGPPVHDDLAEAMADVVADDLDGAPAGVVRPGLLGAGLLAALSAWALAQVGPSVPVAGIAASLALAVLASAAGLSRRADDPQAVVATAWAATAYAAAAALLCLRRDTPVALAVVAAGWGVLVTAATARLLFARAGGGLPDRRTAERQMAPALVLGGVLAGGGLLVHTVGGRRWSAWFSAVGPDLLTGLVVALAAGGLLLLGRDAVRG